MLLYAANPGFDWLIPCQSQKDKCAHIYLSIVVAQVCRGLRSNNVATHYHIESHDV